MVALAASMSAASTIAMATTGDTDAPAIAAADKNVWFSKCSPDGDKKWATDGRFCRVKLRRLFKS